MTEQNDARLTVNVPEAASLLGVSIPTVWQMVHSGRLSSIRCGTRRYVISKAVLQRMLGNGTGTEK